MSLVRNLLKYTLGLPMLFVITISILVLCSFDLLMGLITGYSNCYEFLEDLKDFWKPLK